MAMTTHESLSGFIASDPLLTRTNNGDARFYARVGQEHFDRKDDGSFEKLDPTFTDLVLFRASAERAFEKFQKGDNFLAEGESRSYTQNVDGQDVTREQFIARRIGHDNNRTNYNVDRAPRAHAITTETAGREEVSHEAAHEPVDADPVAAALARREADLEPATQNPVETAIREALAR